MITPGVPFSSVFTAEAKPRFSRSGPMIRVPHLADDEKCSGASIDGLFTWADTVLTGLRRLFS